MSVRLHRRHDEEGVTIVVVALLLAGLLMIVGLAVDGGRAYTSRRQAQNAADSAALAGTEALFSYQYTRSQNNAANGTIVNAAVVKKLDENGVTTGQTCFYVTATGASTGTACTATPPDVAAGVVVGGTIVDRTAFAQVGGFGSVTASAQSTATLQPLAGTSTPFIICGESNGDWPILNPPVGNALPTINVPNALAAGVKPVQAAKVGTCGAGSSFKGKAAPSDDTVVVGEYAEGDNGNGNDPDIRDQVAGLVPCPVDGPYTGCDMLVPIADDGYGNGNGKIFLHIAAWGVFHITGDGHGNPKYYGQFRAPAAVATGGQGQFGSQCAVGTQVCLVGLVG